MFWITIVKVKVRSKPVCWKWSCVAEDEMEDSAACEEKQIMCKESFNVRWYWRACVLRSKGEINGQRWNRRSRVCSGRSWERQDRSSWERSLIFPSVITTVNIKEGKLKCHLIQLVDQQFWPGCETCIYAEFCCSVCYWWQGYWWQGYTHFGIDDPFFGCVWSDVIVVQA